MAVKKSTKTKMNQKDLELLEKLSNANAIASNEQEIRDILNEELNTTADKVFCDGIGSIIFQHNARSGKKVLDKDKCPRVAIAAHIDEVAFVVKEINDCGHLILKYIGGTKRLSSFFQKVIITTAKGKKYKGILNGTFSTTQAVNASNPDSTFKMSDLPGRVYVDLGLETAAQVEKLGIQVGDMVTFDSEFEVLNPSNVIAGKAFDDRLGCFVIARVMQKLAKTGHPNNLFAIGTSSEELGVRGARTSSVTVAPDVVIVVDTNYHSNEFDRTSSNKKQIGHGPILVHSDRRCMPNLNMVKLADKVAKDLGIKIQHDMMITGGTDAGEFHLNNGGTPVVTICVPMRYGHSTYSIADTNDVAQAIDIVCEMVKRLDSKKCAEMRKFI